MSEPNFIVDPALKRVFESSFDDTLRRAIYAYLKANYMSRSAFGRAVLNDPNFIVDRLEGGATVKLDTADRILVFIGEQTFRPVLVFELDAFLAISGLAPWIVGLTAINNPSFIKRVRAGASPWLSSVDGIRDWMRVQVRAEQRRAILEYVARRLACEPDAAQRAVGT